MISQDDGPVRWAFIGNDADFAAEDFHSQYQKILQSFNSLSGLSFTEQVHGDLAVFAPGFTGIQNLGEADALYATAEKLGVLIRTADCIPILFYDSKGETIGAVHAGWRGLEKKILTKTVAELACLPNLRFVVGPFIAAESYEVGSDVAGRFPSLSAKPKSNGKFLLDLRAVLENEFASLGVKADQIRWYAEDTHTSPHWYSARRGDNKRNLALIYRR